MRPLIGPAGEHYVMCQLLRLGYVAALAPAGVPNADIVVTDAVGERLCAIQVKSRRAIGADGGWHMKARHEELVSPLLFYCFVDFGTTTDTAPQCWVVPSAVVADALARSYAYWISHVGRTGRARKTTELRRFLPNYEQTGIEIGCGAGWLERYREAWSLLRDDASADVQRGGDPYPVSQFAASFRSGGRSNRSLE